MADGVKKIRNPKFEIRNKSQTLKREKANSKPENKNTNHR